MCEELFDTYQRDRADEVRLDRTEWGMMRWMCGFILKERQKNTELKELLGLRKVGIGIVVFNVPLDTL